MYSMAWKMEEGEFKSRGYKIIGFSRLKANLVP